MSRHALDRDSRSRHFKNRHLDTSKPKSRQSRLPYNVEKSRFLSRSQSRLSISTFQKPTSQLSRKSGQFEKGHLDMSRHLDLDLNCSRLLRPPGLHIPVIFTRFLNFFQALIQSRFKKHLATKKEDTTSWAKHILKPKKLKMQTNFYFINFRKLIISREHFTTLF